MDWVERSAGADRLLDMVTRAIKRLPLGRGRDALHGRWLGHPVHPALVQVPVGAWTSAAVLDLVPGQRKAAGTLIAVGLAGAGPAALAGWIDWAELHRQQQRVGLVHAAANTAAVVLYCGSLVARIRGQNVRGVTLGFAGLSVAGVGSAIGGHLAYRQAAGANHAEQVPHLVGAGWHDIGAAADFPVGEAVRRAINAVPVLVVRESEQAVHVIAEQCSHLGGPLSEGVIEHGCVRCPWHGSLFRMSDGWNLQGPATAPQPSFETKIASGRLHARLRQAAVERSSTPAA
ncbi:Rieske (2Fe-2S) protein [Streptomyces sp. NPDC051907]|uniref:Rieske (2Fe-2S) protein n=1 Tax=Streptomyces sp. NPDC051907 TaxID=3155284 RepID=UPI003444A3BC